MNCLQNTTSYIQSTEWHGAKVYSRSSSSALHSDEAIAILFKKFAHIKLWVKFLVDNGTDTTFLLWAFLLFAAERLFCFPEQKFVRTDAQQSARFKILVDDQTLTTSPFSGWGKGNVAENSEYFTGVTEGKICYILHRLSKF